MIRSTRLTVARLTVARLTAGLVTAALALPPHAAALAQRDELPRNDPSTCPYTAGDPELLAAAGVVSLGGFEFGRLDTAGVDQLLGYVDILWVETEHFELGFGLGDYQVKQEERDKIRAELEQLALHWPEVKPKTRRLDPWLRAHLYAQRLEKAYARLLEVLQVEPSDFPDGSSSWNMQGKYMGEGPYLGQKGKYEVLILPSETASVAFLRDQYGLGTQHTQRWNTIERDSLIVVSHDKQGGLRSDSALHGHIVFNTTINMFDGYKHYSYDTPVWLREGLAHFMERELDPRYNTFDMAEGSAGVTTKKWKWQKEVKALVRAEQAARTAQLLAMRSYAEIDFDEHIVTWSKTEFMIRVHPDGYACLLDQLKGRKSGDGTDDSAKLDDVHRDAFKQCFGMTHSEFDAAWAAWVEETYSTNQ